MAQMTILRKITSEQKNWSGEFIWNLWRTRPSCGSWELFENYRSSFWKLKTKIIHRQVSLESINRNKLTSAWKIYLSSMEPRRARPPTSHNWRLTFLCDPRLRLLVKKSIPAVGVYCLENSSLQNLTAMLVYKNKNLTMQRDRDYTWWIFSEPRSDARNTMRRKVFSIGHIRRVYAKELKSIIDHFVQFHGLKLQRSFKLKFICFLWIASESAAE